MLIIPLINNIYIHLNNSTRGVYNLVTDIDKKIPFIKEFIIVYWIWYPFIFFTLVYFCFKNKKTYYKAIFTIVTGMISCYVIYYFFQTTVPRPVLQGEDFFTNIVRFTYNLDNPFNCFPSIHVLTSYVMINGIRECGEKRSFDRLIVSFIAIAIIMSTQFVKQHVILDLIFAILLAEGIYRVADIFTLERSLVWKKKLYWWWTTKKKLET